MSNPCDIIVVGAGVAGLTLALACRRQGYTVTVLERDRTRSYRRQGYFLMLPDACVAAVTDFCSLDPGGARPAYVVDIDAKGTMPLLKKIPQSESQFGASSGGCVPRGPFRDRMLDACAQRGISVRFDAEVVDIERSEDGLCVAISKVGRFPGRVLVGCDGIHSQVRSWLVPALSLEACGSVCVRGFATDSGAIRELAGQEPGSREPTLGVVETPPGLGMNMTLVGGKITWVVETRHADAEHLNVTGARSAIEEATRGFHPVLRKLLLEDTSEEAIYIEVLRDLGLWAGPFGSGALTLLGDAAHPTVWFGGGGRGIIDAIELAKTLGPAPLPADVEVRLRKAEAAMQARAPAEQSALEMRDKLPSAVTAAREEGYRKSVQGRPVRWRTQQAGRQEAKL